MTKQAIVAPALSCLVYVLVPSVQAQTTCLGANCPSVSEDFFTTYEKLAELQVQLARLQNARIHTSIDDDPDETRQQCIDRCARQFRQSMGYCRSANTLLMTEDDKNVFSNACADNELNRLIKCLQPVGLQDCPQE